MTRDFLKPQKTSGLDTNAPVAKQSPFASRPFARIPRPEMSPQDIQTMRERAARVEQLGNPMRKAWANTQPTVQRDAMPEEEKEENLQMKADEAVQREEIEEEETLQTKSESTIQRQELEEEDETLQTKSESTLQREELEEEKESIQTKLTIGQPGDKYEQEADNMAAQVMSMPDPTAQNVQRQEIEEEETLQQKPLTDSITPVVQRQTSETQQQDSAGQNLESQLTAEKGGGSPLSDEVRGFMEPRFGADFSEVRVHTGSAAVQMNQQLGAQAFTHGNDIYYGKGKAPGNDALTAHELTHTIQQTSSQIQCQSKENLDTPEKNKHPSADELTTRIARCIGIWETNRGKDNPAPKESSLDTVASVHASMATIEQATMPYAITALKKHKQLRDKASPPLTMKELSNAEARCIAVRILLKSIDRASAKGKTSDDFIKNNTAAISRSGLSNDDVKTMFSAVTLKSTLDTANASVKAAKGKAAKQKTIKEAIDAIPANDRLGLGEGSLKAYINKPKKWGENRAAWQRKAVSLMPNNVGSRIETIAVSDKGTALALPVIKDRVNTELAKKPVPSLENIVKAVAQKNNPNEDNYGKNVWKTYNRLYSAAERLPGSSPVESPEPASATSAHINIPTTSGISVDGESLAVERNTILGSRLGWESQVDEIVAHFQYLGFLPPLQTPNNQTFAYAVRQYQQQNPRLGNDGILGPNTWRQLRADLATSQQQTTESDNQERGTPTTPPWITIAQAEIGVRERSGERHHPRIIEYHSTTGRFSDDETPWCASFVNWVLQEAGQGGTGSARALSFRNYGRQLERPAYGSIAVFSWGGGRGHVGFVVGRQGNRLLILGGNQGDQVQVKAFDTSKIVAYVVPPGYLVANTAYDLVASEQQVASGGGVAETR